MSFLILAGKVAGTSALAAGAMFAGVGATHAATTTTADPTTPSATHCVDLRNAPPALKKDIRALRALPKGSQARIDARRLIRRAALAGKYGTGVQQAAQRARTLRKEFIANAPVALKNDLRAARHQPAGPERRAAIKTVWVKALDGGYGAEVQTRAKALKEHRMMCRAQHHTSA